MAAFRQHISVSTALGAAYTGILIYHEGLDWGLAGLAGLLCAVGGMLPDLDSQTGRPVQELFGLTAAVLPILLLQRLRELELTPEAIILALVGGYFAIRFLAPMILGKLTVHRGMFHSIPAALIAAEIVFLAHKSGNSLGPWFLAGGIFLGFMSHLVMDEIWSVNVDGIAIRLNKAAGSALKLFSSSIPATVSCWALLGVLSYMVGVREGYLKPIQLPIQGLPGVHAMK